MTDVIRRTETPSALVVTYHDREPTLLGAEQRLAQLRRENPRKRVIRAALYESSSDGQVAEQAKVTDVSFPAWQRQYREQRLSAQPASEAVQIGKWGVAREFRDGITHSENVKGLEPLEEMYCGQSKMRFLYVAEGIIGYERAPFTAIFFQWRNEVSLGDVECLAAKLELERLGPATLAVSSDPFFLLDSWYPFFNRFDATSYQEADRWTEGPSRKADDYYCNSINKRRPVSCVHLPPPLPMP